MGSSCSYCYTMSMLGRFLGYGLGQALSRGAKLWYTAHTTQGTPAVAVKPSSMVVAL